MVSKKCEISSSEELKSLISSGELPEVWDACKSEVLLFDVPKEDILEAFLSQIERTQEN